ncbi:MAG: hypothetical protein GWN79_07145, partial [Actinobacteria bacterium]|nr:hypothetical protein [Actinomycetota bacterium]NIU18878.1 hypothetical protein [Actinomycetota bacterium]NIU65853.1 hypothetical protein [Actinomycetota bacterium]
MSTVAADTSVKPVPLLVDRQKMSYELADEIGYRARIGVVVLASDFTIE